MYISSSDRNSIIECYFLVEANLFSTEPILAALDEILKQRQADPDIVKWFNTKYLNWYKSAEDDDLKNIRPHEVKSGEPDWARNTVDFQGFTQQEKNNILHIIDYFNSLDNQNRSKIEKEPYKVIINKVAEWDKQLAANMEKAAVVGEEGKDYETVMRFPDGFSIVRLISKEAYKNEGDAMGHCVGGYCPDSGSIIYSLRSPKGTSHATIEYINKAIRQIKGKQNAAPIEKYRPYLIEFIKKNKMKVINDGYNIGMIHYDHTYYFPDDPGWLAIYKNEIEPLQRKAIEDILSRMKNGVIEGDVKLVNKLYFTKFPDALSNLTFIKGTLDMSNTIITQLPAGLEVGGDLYMDNTPIAQFPADLKVRGSLSLSETFITQLPAGLKVGGYLELSETPIAQLPADLKVESDLVLRYTPIDQLPAGLEVGGNLDLYASAITQLPADLKVGGNLYLYGTPMSEKYTEEQLKQMLPGVIGDILIDSY